MTRTLLTALTFAALAPAAVGETNETILARIKAAEASARDDGQDARLDKLEKAVQVLTARLDQFCPAPAGTSYKAVGNTVYACTDAGCTQLASRTVPADYRSGNPCPAGICGDNCPCPPGCCPPCCPPVDAGLRTVYSSPPAYTFPISTYYAQAPTPVTYYAQPAAYTTGTVYGSTRAERRAARGPVFGGGKCCGN